MDQKHRKCLMDNLLPLSQDMDGSQVLIYLQQQELINEAHFDDLSAALRTSRSTGNANIVNFLMKRGPLAFEKFVNSLYYTHQEHLAALLRPLLPVEYQPPTPQSRRASRLEHPGNDMKLGDVTQRSQSPFDENQNHRPFGPIDQIKLELAEKFYREKMLIDDKFLEQVVPTDGLLNIEVKDTPDSILSSFMRGGNKDSKEFDAVRIYSNFSKPKGLALIFNNRDFSNMAVRTGTDIDAKNLDLLFTKLGYIVKVKHNHTKQEMMDAMARFALKREHAICDSAVVIVLSHGEHGEVFGVDDQPLRINQLLHFLEPTNCPALHGKPKLFFLQACRGDRYNVGHVGSDFADYSKVATKELESPHDEGYEKTLRLLSMTKNYDAARELNVQERMMALNGMDLCDVKVLERTLRLPDDCDFFIGYATTPGFVSWRNSMKGSWFVQAICLVFQEYACREELMSLMTMVNAMVAEKYSSTGGGYKQMPEPTSRLRKKFFFFKDLDSPPNTIVT